MNSLITADTANNHLYGAALEDFIATRTTLARAATEAGDRALAAELKKLPKPTRAGWLVNQLSRQRPDSVQELAELAELLIEAHHTLSVRELAELTRQRGVVVSTLTQEAVEVGLELGYVTTGAVRQEVSNTLTAALADPVVADLVRRGCVTQAVSFSGFGPLGSGGDAGGLGGLGSGGLGGPGADGPDAAPVVDLAAHRRHAALTKAKKAVEKALAEQRRRALVRDELAQRETQQRERLATAEANIAALEQQLATARTRVKEATAELDQLGPKLVTANTEVSDAAAALTKAEAELAKLENSST